MYTGKVDTTEENLPNVLKAAMKLKIKGLVDNKPEIHEGPSAKKRRIEYDNDDSLLSISSLSKEKDDDIQITQNEHETNPVFPYMQWLMMNQMQPVQSPYSMIPQLPEEPPNLSMSLSLTTEDIAKDHHKCNICHRFFDKHSSLISHTRYNHMPMKTPKYCCDQPFLTRWDLKLHKTEHTMGNSNNGRRDNHLDMSRSLVEEYSDSENKLVIDI